MLGIIFNTVKEAHDYDQSLNSFDPNGVTKYRWTIRELTNGKYALLVGNDLDSYDNKDNLSRPDNVVDVSGLILTSEGE